MPGIVSPTEEQLKLFVPFDASSKVAFQYCNDPRADLPTQNQLDQYQFVIVDEWFCYPDFQNYYGPSNLAHILRFTEIVKDLHSENGKTVCVRTSPNSMQRSNVAFLICIYLFLQEEMPVEEILEKMAPVLETVVHYRTEGFGACSHHVSIRDCLVGFQVMMQHFDLDLHRFSIEELLLMEQPQTGDMNWIVPGMILALAGPTPLNWPITKFIDYAKKHDVGCLVRLNRSHYDAATVKAAGIEHIEMFMHDGANPSDENIRDFIALCEKHFQDNKALSVHCRAGLGRTGTMIISYLLWKLAKDVSSERDDHSASCPCADMPPDQLARALVGYTRVMRPGSVLSGQPEFIESMAQCIVKAGLHNDVSLISDAEMCAWEEESQVASLEQELELEVVISEASTLASAPSAPSAPSSASSASSSVEDASVRQSQRAKRTKHFPVSQAGRGRAAEKHSNVHLEKV